MKMKRLGLVAAATLAMASHSLAAVHYFTQNKTLYSWGGGPLGQVEINGVGINASARFPALAFHPGTGQLWGANSADNSFYSINPSTGAATKLFTYGGSGDIISFDFRNVNGNWQVFGMAGGNLVGFNANSTGTPAALFNYNKGGGWPATAYSGSTYYGANNGDRKLYKLDFDNGTTGDAIGLIKENNSTITWNLAGGAWHNGQMYMGLRQGGTVRLGVLGIPSGSGDVSWTHLRTFYEMPGADAMGYAIAGPAIPVPAAAFLGLMGAAIVAFAKRRLA